MIGSLVISSRGAPERLPMFDDSDLSGKHTDSPDKGHWWLKTEGCSVNTVYLPQRDRTVEIYSHSSELVPVDWERHMALWDCQDQQTQYQKLESLRAHISSSAVRTAAIHMKYGSGSLGTWSLIRNSFSPIHVYGVMNERSTYLVWSNEELANSLRMMNPGTYRIFHFPTRFWQMFLNTQAICSKWWRWNSKFGDDTLRMFNALEVMLLKVK